MTRIVDCPGSVTVRNAEEFRQSLIHACAGSQGVALNLAPIEEVDLSFLQIVHAARISLAARGRPLDLTHRANAVATALLERAGMLTDASPADLQFWFHGALAQ